MFLFTFVTLPLLHHITPPPKSDIIVFADRQVFQKTNPR